MSCRDYELLIGDAVDGALDDLTQRTLDAHLASCPGCRQIAEDFRAIRAVARQLEAPVPSPQVWTRIAAAVDANRRRRFLGFVVPAWPQLAAAAVALTLMTGVGWMVWRDLSPVTNPDGDLVAADISDRDPQSVAVELELAENEYVTAIASLEAIANASRVELDPQTADVLEANLIVIDQAIGESRAALQEEPASDLAQDSLFDALRTKVALLHDTVALINEMRKGNQEGAARIVSGLNQ